MYESDLERATDHLGAALLLEDGVPDAMAGFAAAHGAMGSLLIGTGPNRDARIFETPSISVPVALYLAGDRPNDIRENRVQVGPWRGFATDLDDFKPEEIARDPYYQEFLRPHGVAWHACTWLDGDDGHELVISLKRSPRQGHFERHEIARLDTQLGKLRLTFTLKKHLGAWTARGGEAALERTDRGLAWLSHTGGIVAASRLFEEVARGFVVFSAKTVRTASPAQQGGYDAAFRAALQGRRSGQVVLTDEAGRRLLVQFSFVGSDLADFLGTGAMLVTATPLAHRTEPSASATSMAAELFGLTATEARVAVLVACGWSLSDAAARLRIKVGTSRNYLKAVFLKTGVTRQVELATLLRPIVSE